MVKVEVEEGKSRKTESMAMTITVQSRDIGLGRVTELEMKTSLGLVKMPTIDQKQSELQMFQVDIAADIILVKSWNRILEI